MTYQIKTPILGSIANGTLKVFNDAVAGAADIKQGQLAVSAGSSIRRAVETDLRIRLSSAKLAQAEAEAAQA